MSRSLQLRSKGEPQTDKGTFRIHIRTDAVHRYSKKAGNTVKEAGRIYVTCYYITTFFLCQHFFFTFFDKSASFFKKYSKKLKNVHFLSDFILKYMHKGAQQTKKRAQTHQNGPTTVKKTGKIKKKF